MAMAVNYQLGDFPPEQLDWPQLIPLLGPASAAVTRYDGTLAAIPNASVLLSPLTTQEAVLSSRIEGTQATMGEVLEFEAEGDKPELSRLKYAILALEADFQELEFRGQRRHPGRHGQAYSVSAAP